MRLFVGVELDQGVRDAAAALSDSLRRDLGQRVDARWVPAANLHITLWFLGEVEPSSVQSTMRALESAFHEGAFDLEISGLGAFPPSGSPRVFWLGVTAGAASLARLHAELTSRLEPLGFAAERRVYSAHLTIARVKEISRGVSSDDIRATLRSRPAQAGRCRVEAVTVFRSRVSSKGATYEALQRVRLQ
ncbi:MAG: RNA 2',3'-cyclic phosphodiesterase [Vicinamibacterales bacterium]